MVIAEERSAQRSELDRSQLLFDHAGERIASSVAGAGKVEKRPNGPYAASFDARGNNWSIEWSARQMGGEQREVKITPEMREALDKLRRK